MNLIASSLSYSSPDAAQLTGEFPSPVGEINRIEPLRPVTPRKKRGPTGSRPSEKPAAPRRKAPLGPGRIIDEYAR
ncbi:MAG: hypothetical protein ABSF50_07420 [Burkholderiaceae bacterium]|jgi:hypothetical protein